jgi:SAM-dependent methyltransferase
MDNRRKIIKKEIKKFKEKELHDIYYKIVKKDNTYFQKYQILPICPVKAWNFIWDNHDMPRNFAILDFIDWVKKYEITEINNLGLTCNADPELEFISCKEKTELPFPPFDLHEYYDHLFEKFDFFIFNQTIEHLYNPFVALKNIYKYIKKGGYVYTSVPTINIPHSTPIHYNGYNPMGLTLLFLTAGFEILEVGQWGNYDYIQKLFKNHKWPDASKTERGCSHLNEERNVCQCWILAKKI